MSVNPEVFRPLQIGLGGESSRPPGLGNSGTSRQIRKWKCRRGVVTFCYFQSVWAPLSTVPFFRPCPSFGEHWVLKESSRSGNY